MFTQIPWVGPRPSSSAEPTTGPHKMPSDLAVELSRMALGRSARPTKSSSSSCSGGAHSAPAMPCRISSTHAFQTVRVPVANRTPQVSDTVMNSPWDAWMSLRQSRRSARAPK
jgi:hypothetical protein